MAITINGSGTITGVSAGGLPDGCVTADDLASGAITAGTLPAGTIINHSAGTIDMTTGIAGSGTTWRSSGINFSITASKANSDFIVTASGWTAHMNSPSNDGTKFELRRKVNSGSYVTTTNYHIFSTFVQGSTASDWTNHPAHVHLYDSASTHNVGDTVTYEFWYAPFDAGGGYFNHTGGDGIGTMSWTILEV